MNKEAYLATLRNHLKHISEDEKNDIIDEYHIHFLDGMRDGKSEAQISEELGHPKDIAKEMNASMAVERAHESGKVGDVGKAIIATIGLGVLNFFVITIPFMFIVGILFTIASMSVGFVTAPLFMILKGATDGFNNLMPLEVYVSLTMFGIGLIFLVIAIKAIKSFIKLCVRYLKWNIDQFKRSTKA
ncbi:HAAS signaling domain-containing protein [Staphylococcus massiliensis]|uniref:DUF1700 domain-containing protein n=1 Tax=Staphylococcus massiliensis S46 TaxID=1229783 RepID=K9B5I6_9STAP|nr:DUF1700 domain-containing protein [Staphylococcus massiliensis]EKU49030.1 hypothetical protein C273_04475 [Staphylococcus massiliensis S46]MCG3399473.1 DUF1700 domain-containing protein [Staphylococcus massiliensis]MCG3402427.1 DUF1700 domain-containing protein [Staphylococcus massiliensis]MCG3411609.1 DUF1700 domain-containing protein [Staphylococcus massiliensis]PNZ99505.1 DUF1700 domain-containing protein [Staphylococcus massiliensis CCUG 55927]